MDCDVLTAPLLLLAIALTPAESFNRGNQSYARGDYPAAVESYARALNGAPHPAVLYNLGNAYFKSGQVGRAVASYQRARFLAPRDNDVQTNLRFARSYRVDKVLSVPGPIEDLIDRSLHVVSQREALVLAAVCFSLACLFGSLFVVYRRRPLSYGAIALFLAFIFGMVTAGVWHGYVSSRPAAVIVPEATARSGPGEDYKDIVLIHDGTEVAVRETRGEWLLVQLPGGAGGWVKREALELIFP
jgi:hypothetical protein